MSFLLERLTQQYGLLAGWQWITLFSIPPLVVLLYFLKLRRQPLEVPSTYLWRKTIEDLHVNSFWQKLRQNLLLFLQLLLLLLAILACFRPSWEGSQLTDERYVFLVDTSASMTATDVAPNRLEAVKAKLEELVDKQMQSGSVAMVISFSDRPIIEQPFTDNRNLLKRRIRAIQPTQRGSDLEEALRFAAGLANPGRTASDETDAAAAEAMPATLMIFSDGRFRRSPQFAMGNLKPIYVPIGSAQSQNVAIVAFNASVNPEKSERMQVFGQIQNFGDQPAKLTANLALYQPNRNLIDAAEVEVPPGETRGVEFTLDTIESGELRLELETADALSLDNTAFAAVNPRRRARVLLVTSQNDALETVLSTQFSLKLAETRIESPDFLKTPEYQQKSSSGALDLIIYDQCAPAAMPLCNTVFIGAVPPDGRWQVDAAQELPQIIDSDRVHPLMRFVELGDIKWIVEATPLKPPSGSTTLIESHVGTLLGVAPRDGYEDVVLGFPIVGTDKKDGSRFSNTDWPIRVSFPVFVGNVLTYLGGAKFEAASNTTLPGQSVTVRTQSLAKSIEVTTPAGKRQTVERSAQSAFVFGGADGVGVYSVLEEGQQDVTERFAVNLFDANESNIRPAEMVKTQYEDIQGQATLETKRYEAWKYLVILALVVLMIEWYVYNRRVYI